MLPAVSEDLSIFNRQVEQSSDTVYILDFDFLISLNLSELGKGRNEQIPNVMHLVVSTDSDTVDETLQAKVCNDWIVSLVHYKTKHGEISLPSVLKHRQDGRGVFNKHKGIALTLLGSEKFLSSAHLHLTFLIE